MRFKAKIDYVFLALWSLAHVVLGSYLIFRVHRVNPQVSTYYFAIAFLLWLFLLAVVLLRRLGRYYEFQAGGLLIRKGWSKSLIRYTAVDKFLPLAPSRWWFPTGNQYLLMPDNQISYTIAVAKKGEFITELSRRCPQLEWRETPYGLSLQRHIH
jgi:hypothetical protein